MAGALLFAVSLGACGNGEGTALSEEEAAVTTTGSAGTEDRADGTPEVSVPECPPPEAVVMEGPLECDFPVTVFDERAEPSDRVAAMGATAREHGYTEAADALADGELTVAEKRQAYQDALDCMTTQGMVVVQFEEYEGLYGTEFTFIVGRGVQSDADASRISSECEGRYTWLPGWADRILGGERFTERAREILQQCLAEHGVTEDVGDTMDELREVVPSAEAEIECVGRAEQKPPPPAGLVPQTDG